MSRVSKVESEVPFGHTLYSKLYLNGMRLDKVVHHNRMETHYLAWETVRQQTNPFFEKGTGFEGYLIGSCTCSEAALERILAIGQNILDAIARAHRFEHNMRAQLIRTLDQDTGNSEYIQIWSGYLGAELGRLRAQILTNKTAQDFRIHTYHIVNGLHPIDYHEVTGDVMQSYELGSDPQQTCHKLTIQATDLPAVQQDAWRVSENIGKFGHPLVRQLLVHGIDAYLDKRWHTDHSFWCWRN